MHAAELPGRRRSWLRFFLGLRGLMVLVLLLGGVLGWYVRSVRLQQEAVAAVTRAGGSVGYDWEWGNYNPSIVSANDRRRMPRWLAARLGVDYVASVISVDLSPRRRTPRGQTDAALARVGQLSHVEYLNLSRSDVTDAGMAHLKGMSSLRQLTLNQTGVGDAGLARLHGLPALRFVDVAWTRVTDRGILALKKALPEAFLVLDENVVDRSTQARAEADLDFARSLPVRQAIARLIDNARRHAMRDDRARLVATLDAYCGLEPDTVLGLVKMAEGCNEAVGFLGSSLSPRLPAAQRLALQRQCADRGLAALARAVEMGFDDPYVLEGDGPSRSMGLRGTLRAHSSGR